MEQQQIKVSFSVGAKLLLGVVTLLFVAIMFLDLSTIYIVTQDKRAYVFQAQSTEAQLAGREFVSATKLAIDPLRLSLAQMDRNGKLDASRKATLQSVVNNQSELVGIRIVLLPPEESGEILRAADVSHQALTEKLGISSEAIEIDPAALKSLRERLQYSPIAHLNVSRIGQSPLLGIAYADSTPGKSLTQVAIGFLPLANFARGLSGSDVTVADRSGQVLFSTDSALMFGGTIDLNDPLFKTGFESQTAEGTLEFEDPDSGRFLGSYVRPGFDVVALTRTQWARAMRATYTLTERFILLGLMAIGGAILFAVFFSKTVTAPIQQLYSATKQVSAGDFNIDLPSKSRDEIGALSQSFVAMSRKITELIAESMRKVQLENELAIASTVQQTLIPPSSFSNDDVLIQSHYQSAAECGGDWWGFFGVGHRVTLMISDATGHGLPSALITAAARSCFSVMHKLAQEDPEFSFSPGSMLSYANRVVHDAADGKINMTFFIAVMDFESGTLTYSSAGHNPPWLFQKDGDRFKLKSLMAEGNRLGETRDVAPYQEQSVPIAVGDILFLYTDGLMEGKDQAGEMFGKKRVKKLVEGNIHQGPQAALSALLKEFLQHNQDKPLDDDLTLAFAQVKRISGGSKT